MVSECSTSSRDIVGVLASRMTQHALRLILSGGDVTGELTEWMSHFSKALKSVDCTSRVLFRQGAGALDTGKGGVGLFASLRIGVGILAKFLQRAGDVQDVVS